MSQGDVCRHVHSVVFSVLPSLALSGTQGQANGYNRIGVPGSVHAFRLAVTVLPVRLKSKAAEA